MSQESENQEIDIDDRKVGFNLNTQMLHCLVILNDQLASSLSTKAGSAFFRAFIVEDRKSGEILANMRFRYKDGDSWMRLQVGADKQHFNQKERIEHLVQGIERVMRLGTKVFLGTFSLPDEAVVCLYPPHPEDGHQTLDWLMEQDLIEITKVVREGESVPVQKEQSA